MTDLFNNWQKLPNEVQEIICEYDSYLQCESLVKNLNKVGYTCEYGLDAIPLILKKYNYETISST